jgi:hypothetical protein
METYHDTDRREIGVGSLGSFETAHPGLEISGAYEWYVSHTPRGGLDSALDLRAIG